MTTYSNTTDLLNDVVAGTATLSVVGGTGGGGTASSVSIQDGTTSSQKAAVSASGAVKVDGSAVTQPVSLASLPALAAGSAVIGHVIVDAAPTTAITYTQQALVAGTAIVGKVGIDQTTNGTTNRVNIGSDGTVAVNNFPATQAVSLNTVSTSTVTRVTGSSSSVQVLAANANRKSFILYNENTASVCIKFGTTASTTDYSFQLFSGQTYIADYPVYTGRIDAITTNVTLTIQATELT